MAHYLRILGAEGDPLHSPQDTMTSLWSALGASSDGLYITVRLSRDNQVICCEYESLANTCDDPRNISDVDYATLVQLDAGKTFRSTVLDNNHQPTGEHGLDYPWAADPTAKFRTNLFHPRLEEVLRLFARRTLLAIAFPCDLNEQRSKRLMEETAVLLQQFGETNNVLLLAEAQLIPAIQSRLPSTPLAMLPGATQSPVEAITQAAQLGAKQIKLTIESICQCHASNVDLDPAVAAALLTNDIRAIVSSETMPYAPAPAYFAALVTQPMITTLIARSVSDARACQNGQALIAADDFAGSQINQDLWSAGYSHPNDYTEIKQEDSLIIHIRQEPKGATQRTYSGAAIVTQFPVQGDFDARVSFHVANPTQGTTFELVALSKDAGRFHINNTDLDTTNVNLVFDVHGSPPYASSERDQNDGFRCGWNNGYDPIKVDPDWEASSVNMYNQYGRDVGDGSADSPTGELRLTRHGSIFNTYYRDKNNTNWVCSGSVFVPNLSQEAHLRLAAKHWHKGGPAPANEIRFLDFKLYQPVQLKTDLPWRAKTHSSVVSNKAVKKSRRFEMHSTDTA
ncbi:glycerophosphodiester phosphodiesterase [Kaarinaea lacus]